MTPRNFFRQFSRHAWKSVFIGILGCGGSVLGQFTVSPTQTNSFFSDLRTRSYQYRNDLPTQQAFTNGSEGVYDFTRGEYISDPDNQFAAETPEDEVSRALGQPNYMNSFAGYSRRLAGDYTQAAGPYPSSTSFFAPTYTGDPFLDGHRNIVLGPVGIAVGLNADLQYDDNILRTPSNKIGDFIGGLYMNFDALYPISQYNQLSLATQIGIDHYFEHQNLSPTGKGFVFNVAPGTTIAFDVKIGEVVVTLYDRMAVRPVTADAFAVDDLQLFGVFNNDAGIGVNWAINSKLNLSLYYNRSDSRALQSTYDIYDRSIDAVGGSLAWTPTGTWTIGLETSFSWIHYLESYNNDGTTFNLGAFGVFPITKGTTLKVAGGGQDFNFNQPPAYKMTVTTSDVSNLENQLTALNKQLANTANISDPGQAALTQQSLVNQINEVSNQLGISQATLNAENAYTSAHSGDTTSHLGGYYYNVTVNNQLNSRINQYISFGHESALNTDTNFLTSDYVTYGIGAIVWQGARLTLSGYYEKSDDSGGRLAENINQYGFDAYLSHRLSENLTGGLGYHFGNTHSDVEGRSYLQHALTVDLNYTLSRKMSVGLGYRFLTTSADDPTLSFDDNRIIATFNYNF